MNKFISRYARQEQKKGAHISGTINCTAGDL